jgi:UDP-N-acetyl-2-amino-2-deoxyglucuronate dehydrogenase
MMKVLTIVGAWPQFIKAAAVSRVIRDSHTGKIEEVLVHIGQHYDENMSQVFFDEPDRDAGYQATAVHGYGHPFLYGNIINVLRGMENPETDGREGLKSLEVLIATYLSARDGRRVVQPLDY